MLVLKPRSYTLHTYPPYIITPPRIMCLPVLLTTARRLRKCLRPVEVHTPP